MNMIEPFKAFWYMSSSSRKAITDSLLLSSGTEVLSAMIWNFDFAVRVCGDVRIVWKGQSYRDVTQFPDDLVEVIRNGKLDEHEDAYVDMSNWYELFVYDQTKPDGANCILTEVVDIDISSMTPKEAREFILDWYESAVENTARFKVGDHVACVNGSQIRNHYVVAEILAPGKAPKDLSKYPGWSIRNHVNESNEIQYVCPDGLAGITFVFQESEVKPFE